MLPMNRQDDGRVQPSGPLVVYGSAIAFEDIGLASRDTIRQFDARGGRTRGVVSPTEEKFRVVVNEHGGAPGASTVEVIRTCDHLGNNREDHFDVDDDDGVVDGDREAYDAYRDEEALLMEEMARMGLPVGFGKDNRGHYYSEALAYDRERHTWKGDERTVGDVDFAGGSSRRHVRFIDDGEQNEGEEDETTHSRRTVKVKKRNPKKYWLQRYSLFSLYDKGIQIDDEGWYSATPEVIAWHHASMIVKANGRGCVVYDVFGGVGGNAIQLALAGCHVLVTEICPDKAYMIRNNARVYGVQERVEVVIGDAMHVGPRLRPGLIDAVLLSPPWGGPAYSQGGLFDVQRMGGCPDLGVGKLLHMAFEELEVSSAVLWLPRTSDLQQLGVEVARLDRRRRVNCHVELAKINGVDKAITVYIGDDERRASVATKAVEKTPKRKKEPGRSSERFSHDIARLVGKLHSKPDSSFPS